MYNIMFIVFKSLNMSTKNNGFIYLFIYLFIIQIYILLRDLKLLRLLLYYTYI